MRFEVIDQCPVPARLAPTLRRIKERTGATLNSCDRSPEAEPMLRRLGKKSQRQLYEGFIKGLPGYNPANPPGRSTHERRNDGVAYAGPVGAKLPFWCVGMDWSNAPAVVAAAGAEGFTASITYPNNPREGHHVNFRRKPKLRPRTLREGSKGRAVRRLTRQLSYVRSVVDGQPYLDGERRNFDAETTAALMRFQREHHQVGDGIYGPNSRRQLQTSIRRMRRQKEGR